MPPKRKRAEADSAEAGSRPTRATRSSKRLGGDDEEMVDVPATKAEPKKRKAPVKANAAKETDGAAVKKKSSISLKPELDLSEPAKKSARGATSKAKAKEKTDSRTENVVLHSDSMLATSEPTSQHQPSSLPSEFTFGNFADPDDPSVIGPEGLERLCTSANLPMEGAMPIILAWILNSQEMGKITRAEWDRGMNSWHITSLSALCTALTELESLLIFNKPVSIPSSTLSPGKGRKGAGGRQSLSTTTEAHDRAIYWTHASNPQAAFSKLYTFAFVLAKGGASRNIEMDTATALWSVLLVPKYPIVTELINFITEKGSYKGANKDLWSMTLEFCKSVDTNLSNYEADGAWPTLLDDFVAWKQAQ